MPVYSYTAKDGETIELEYRMGRQPQRVRRRGKHGCRKLFLRNPVADFRGPVKSYAGWPRESDALGVHPRQVKAAGEALLKAGIKTQFNPKTGACILEDQRHERRVMKELGMVHFNAGYSDMAPGMTGAESRLAEVAGEEREQVSYGPASRA